MPFDPQNTIAQFLDATAAKQPAPGGGSVTALVGALAAAIGEMVLNYSVGKKGLEAHQEDLKSAVAELHRARQVMVELMVEDQVAYQELVAAKKLAADHPTRPTQYAAALGASIATPQLIAVTAAAILSLTDRLVDQVNFYLLSDLAVCAELAMAVVRCGIYNVKVNRSEIKDAAELQKIDEIRGFAFLPLSQ